MFGTIRNSAGESLDTSASAGISREELIVIGHGVTGNKDRPWAVALGQALEREGLGALRFSFSGNGASEGQFVDSTLNKEVTDLAAILDGIRATEGFEKTRLIYVGHSMGAAVGVLRAVKDPRITRLISLAGMVDTQSFAKRKFGELRPGKDCMWEKPECPLSLAYMADMERVGSVLGDASRIEIPWLLVHGDSDPVVPLEDSQQAQKAASQAELVTLKGADHVFSGNATTDMVAAVLSWLRKTA